MEPKSSGIGEPFFKCVDLKHWMTSVFFYQQSFKHRHVFWQIDDNFIEWSVTWPLGLVWLVQKISTMASCKYFRSPWFHQTTSPKHHSNTTVHLACITTLHDVHKTTFLECCNKFLCTFCVTVLHIWQKEAEENSRLNVFFANPQKSPFSSHFQVLCVLRFVPLFPHGEECGVEDLRKLQGVGCF